MPRAFDVEARQGLVLVDQQAVAVEPLVPVKQFGALAAHNVSGHCSELAFDAVAHPAMTRQFCSGCFVGHLPACTTCGPPLVQRGIDHGVLIVSVGMHNGRNVVAVDGLGGLNPHGVRRGRIGLPVLGATRHGLTERIYDSSDAATPS